MCRNFVMPVTIGAFVGIIYGAILWFVKSQVESIYSQAAFRFYFNPGLLAFGTAAICAILCLIVVLTYQYWFGFFERLAIKIGKWQLENAGKQITGTLEEDIEEDVD